MSGTLNCSGWVRKGAGACWSTPGPRPQALERDPHPNLHRSKGNVPRPFPRSQINNEQRRRGQEARLCAEQPAIGSAVVGARALIELLRVAPDVAAVGSPRARVL